MESNAIYKVQVLECIGFNSCHIGRIVLFGNLKHAYEVALKSIFTFADRVGAGRFVIFIGEHSRVLEFVELAPNFVIHKILKFLIEHINHGGGIVRCIEGILAFHCGRIIR